MTSNSIHTPGSVTPATHTGGLANALRARVHTLHTRAERTGFVSDLLRGRAESHSYALLLRNLLPAYTALEYALELHRASPLLANFARPALYRAGAIVTDLTAFSRGWQRDLTLLPEATDYARAITTSAAGDGARLIAHAYTRYMGDLSGGLVVQRLLTRATPGLVLRFHQFPGVPDTEICKSDLRAAIDLAGTLLPDHTSVLDEAALSFQHNINISLAVQAALAR